jgi:xanthine dehydrogenase large subunit
MGERPEFRGVAGEALRHDSALKHTTGEALYVDDIFEPAGTLYLAPGTADVTCGCILRMDLAAVREAPGVVSVLTAADVPGNNDVSPTGCGDDPLLAKSDLRGDRSQLPGSPVGGTPWKDRCRAVGSDSDHRSGT